MDLSLFNDAQRKAILLPISAQSHPEILILAGAGSGKTRVLVYRIAHLIAKGVSPSSILAMTFTKKAANEMKERCIALTGNASGLTLSTFHSLCADLLRKYSPINFSIFDDSEQKSLIKHLIKKHQHVNDVDVKEFMSWMSYQRAKCWNPAVAKKDEDHEIKAFRALYLLYIEEKAKMRIYDFDDLLEKSVLLLEKHPTVKDSLHRKWRYVLIDEYQDTNKRQSQLISLITGQDTQTLKVGDEDQLIYSWRGAEIEHILKSYENSLVNERITCIPLLTNYRCSARILTLANEVVSVNQYRTGKVLTPHLPDGEPVEILSFSSEYDEASYIAKKVRTWEAEGVPLNEIAILVRMNRLGRSLERALIERNIPYHMHNGTAIFDTKEVRLLMNTLWLLEKPSETFYVQQVFDVLKMGIGPAAIVKMASDLSEDKNWITLLTQYANKKGDTKLNSFIGAVKTAKKSIDKGELQHAARVLFDSNALLSAFKEDEHERRGENMLLVLQIIGDYETSKKEESEKGSMAGFQEERLLNDTLTEQGNIGKIQIMTVHKSKGLEFTCGAILGMQDGIFPMMSDSENEEDLRLAYVAITRFKKSLSITRCSFRVGFNDLSSRSSILDPHARHLDRAGVITVKNM